MKQYLIAAVVILAVLVSGYFIMWFFLCQTYALTVQKIVNPQYAAYQSGDQARFLQLYQKASAEIAQSLSKSPGNRFYQKLNGVRGDFSALTDPLAFRLAQMAYWSGIIDLALDRADYSQPTVPMGAMRPILVRYEELWNGLKSSPGLTKYSNESAVLFKRVWIYHSLLKGTKNALTEHLNSGDKARVILALDDIRKNTMKDMRFLVHNVFSGASDADVQMDSVRTLLTLGELKDPKVRQFIHDVLVRSDLPPTPEFVDLVANSKLKEYYEPVAALTNNADQSVRDSAFTALSRLRSAVR